MLTTIRQLHPFRSECVLTTTLFLTTSALVICARTTKSRRTMSKAVVAHSITFDRFRSSSIDSSGLSDAANVSWHFANETPMSGLHSESVSEERPGDPSRSSSKAQVEAWDGTGRRRSTDTDGCDAPVATYVARLTRSQGPGDQHSPSPKSIVAYDRRCSLQQHAGRNTRDGKSASPTLADRRGQSEAKTRASQKWKLQRTRNHNSFEQRAPSGRTEM